MFREISYALNTSIGLYTTNPFQFGLSKYQMLKKILLEIRYLLS